MSETPAYQVVSSEFLNSVQEMMEIDYRDQLLRLRADFDNYRKRHTKEREEAIKLANEGIIMDLLPVLDSFELGLKAAAGTQNSQDLIQGMNMVYTQLQRLLADADVQVIDAMGKPFDPHEHEAVAHEVHEDAPEGIVVAQHRKGYKLHHRLLRPASVVVSHISQNTCETQETA
ncbi:MAG: nucleotide exchange factor GrpE [Verrucomicrobiota bacterium]